MRNKAQDRLIAELRRLLEDEQDRVLASEAVEALDARYQLTRKVAAEPGVGEVVRQMFGRLARSFGVLSDVRAKAILDIPCGSNTSKAPALFRMGTPFGELRIGGSGAGYTAKFEPWFCRILLELGAKPVGVDLGDLEQERFTHLRVDLGEVGALDFLPARSFDAIQDSRLFGSPEFTAQFPNRADRVKVAQEIIRQEARLLKPDGIVIHSDAAVVAASA